MKTIRSIDDVTCPLEYQAGYTDGHNDGFDIGYARGRRETIDKALEWICDNWSIISEFAREEFKKAMEE